MQVSGILAVGEASRTGTAVAARQRGSQAYLWGAMFGLMVLLGGGGWAIGHYFRLADPNAFVFPGLFVAWLLYVLFWRRLVVALFRRRFAERGIARELPLSLTAGPEALIYEVGDIHQSAKWRAVTDLFKSGDYWIFLAQGSAFFAPRRFFASRETERAFIAEALSHMSDDAKARSHEAVLFATISPS